MSNEVTITVADASLPEVSEKQALRALYATRVVTRSDVLMLKNVEGKPGDLIDFTEMGALTVAAIGTDGSVANTAQTQTRRQLALNSFRSTAITVPVQVEAQSILDFGDEFAVAAGGALGADMDNLVMSDYASITTNSEGSTTTPGAMTDALLRASLLDLDALNVAQEMRSFLFHQKAKWELLADPNFKLAYATGASKGAQTTGDLPDLYGIKYRLTSKTATLSGVYKNILLQQEALAFALQKNLTIKMQEVSGSLAKQWIGFYLAGEKFLRENLAVLINTGV